MALYRSCDTIVDQKKTVAYILQHIAERKQNVADIIEDAIMIV